MPSYQGGWILLAEAGSGHHHPPVLKPRWQKDAVQEREAFRDALAAWFSVNGKDYPWRRTKDPYAVLVSEVMLQQTQIATVLGRGFYTRFLEAFPDVQTLAAAQDEPLLKAWEGLGYYRRARMLRDTARAVGERHAGVFPQSMEDLLGLPGVGRYTAGAVRAFAFDLPAAVVDGNVARVLSRLMDFHDAVDDTAGLKRIWEWAETLSDPGRPSVFNSALMELGQTLCRPGVPDCLSCPVAAFCRSHEPEVLPVKRKKAEVTVVAEHALWLRDGKGRVLMHREKGKRREGLWRLPLRDAADLAALPVSTTHRYTITRYRVGLSVHDGGISTMEEREGDEWKTPQEVLELPMASPFRVVVERMLGEN
jgi:A/G-specific adenine glycosylase